MNYGRNMAAARINAGFTQRGAAKELGISQGYISGLEVGKNQPELLALLEKMRDVYKASLDEIVLGSVQGEVVQETNRILSRLSPERYKEIMEIAKLFLLLDSAEYRREVIEELIVSSELFDNNRVLSLLIAARDKDIGDTALGVGVDSLSIADQL